MIEYFVIFEAFSFTYMMTYTQLFKPFQMQTLAKDRKSKLGKNK